MKPQFTFHFADEPQFKTTDSRAHVAHLLRAYRAHPLRYALSKAGVHAYQVRNNPGADHSPVAIIAAEA